jgi:hypothetical protein
VNEEEGGIGMVATQYWRVREEVNMMRNRVLENEDDDKYG